MTTSLVTPPVQDDLVGASLKPQIDTIIDELIASLPDPDKLSSGERRGIIARYTAVLEGNFIYWMTATYLSVKSEEAQPILVDNLMEEIRDCHPAMLRNFTIAAHAFPTDTDALEVHQDLTNVRLFLGRLSGVQNLLTMAFFEGFIQQFMAYLADLAGAQGSVERVYTDVHGVCDVTHSLELFRAVSVEMAVNPIDPSTDLFEGVDLLRTLIQTVIHGRQREGRGLDVGREHSKLQTQLYTDDALVEHAGYCKVSGAYLYTVLHEVPDPLARVLLIGPFASERHNSYLPWVRWARYLAAKGIEVLRYDYRGIGESTGIFEEMTFDHWSEDVELLADWLKSRSPEVPLVLHGLEIGALLAGNAFHSGIGRRAPTVVATGQRTTGAPFHPPTLGGPGTLV